MFKKILIANRGEIACRIIRTARRMGIQTVAVYSEADLDTLHVRMADEAVLIGPAPSVQSYLQIERIVKAAKDTGAEAVHPGFGFLAENTKFAEALAAEGIAFIGPGPHAIAAMGDKIESKKLAIEAGVSTVPGHTEALADADQAVEVACKIGFPVMMKASAGGGGKGMRIAYDEDEARQGFISAANEARTSFGDERVFVEKFIEDPRHIEIQVIGDQHGTIVHLGERECSIQRRHQKVIEEAPSPFLDEETRQAMGAQAVALAKAVDYHSAGTVEFIVDRERNFYFLEMNTRIQVEHPVTEYVTGLDIVELMIAVAAGEKLPFKQEDIHLQGWAVEARVYAEDPDRGFLPSIGRLTRYQPPVEDDHIRVDTGVFEGGEISMFYDPMIAKLIAGGRDRDEAIAKLQDALDSYCIRGVAHNIPFLASLLRHPRFVEGRLTTGFIAEEYPDGFKSTDTPYDDIGQLIAVAAILQHTVEERDRHLSGRQRELPDTGLLRTAVIGDTEYPVSIRQRGGSEQVKVGDSRYTVLGHWRPGQPLFQGTVNDQPVAIQIDRDSLKWRLTHRGHVTTVWILSPRAAELNRWMPAKKELDLSRYLLSPMPGLLVKLLVEPGQQVKAGQELAVVEAMKMENSLRAVHDATVAELLAQPGDALDVDQPIVEFESS